MVKRHVIALSLLVVCAGCTDDTTPATTAPSAPASPSTAPSSAAAPVALKVPAPVKGELVRQVISRRNGTVSGETTVRAEAKADQEYATRVACTATGPGRTLSYDVTSDGKLIAAAEAVPCDGVMLINGVGELPAGAPVTVRFRGDRAGIVTAYAIVVPSTLGS